MDSIYLNRIIDIPLITNAKKGIVAKGNRGIMNVKYVSLSVIAEEQAIGAYLINDGKCAGI